MYARMYSQNSEAFYGARLSTRSASSRRLRSDTVDGRTRRPLAPRRSVLGGDEIALELLSLRLVRRARRRRLALGTRRGARIGLLLGLGFGLGLGLGLEVGEQTV